MDLHQNKPEDFDPDLEQYPLLVFPPSTQMYVRYQMSDELVGTFYQDWLEDGEYHQPTIRRRKTNCLVCDREDNIVASLVINIYSFSTLIDSEEVLYILDIDDAYEARLGLLLETYWSDFGAQVSDYGDLVEIHGLWVEEKSTNLPHLIEAVQYLIYDLPQHSIQIVNASAFYLDELKGTENEQKLWFNAQRAELKQFFRDNLGFTSFPDKDGFEGWMWKIDAHKKDVIKAPSLGDTKRWT